MVRNRSLRDDAYLGSPHTRGDGPSTYGIQACLRRFSPHAWGWSGVGKQSDHETAVLPTRVGMVRCFCVIIGRSRCSPHTRGDGPQLSAIAANSPEFSPHAWGWSGPPVLLRLARLVLPTRVGMVRRTRLLSPRRLRSPHTRGDGPQSGLRGLIEWVFSPHAWGWSAWKKVVDNPT